ncbi:MAG: hypothetical protein EU536_01125 [Promethearchaeota archaeon]|nr:MAG: hypothetical protein EU536_01125 [Candidatus Lokiarchaeota archaeon]
MPALSGRSTARCPDRPARPSSSNMSCRLRRPTPRRRPSHRSESRVGWHSCPSPKSSSRRRKRGFRDRDGKHTRKDGLHRSGEKLRPHHLRSRHRRGPQRRTI